MQDEWRSDSPLGQLWPSIMLSRVPTCSPRLVRSLQRCPWGHVARPFQSGARSSGGPQRAKGTGASPRTALVMRAMCVGLSSQHGLGCSATRPPVPAIFKFQNDELHDSLAEWSKALASGASPQGRGLEPHSFHHAHHHHRSPHPLRLRAHPANHSDTLLLRRTRKSGAAPSPRPRPPPSPMCRVAASAH